MLGIISSKPWLAVKVVVSAPLKEAVKGKLKLAANGGIRLEPKEWEVDLQPGALKVFQVKVKKPADTVSPIRAELTLANGTVLRGQVPTGLKLPPQPKVEGIITEAEDFVGQTGGKVVIRRDKIGVHKKCFSHWDKKGHELTWQLAVPKDGRYQIRIRYAATENARRSFTLNGEPLGTFEIPSSGGFGDSVPTPKEDKIPRLWRGTSISPPCSRAAEGGERHQA